MPIAQWPFQKGRLYSWFIARPGLVGLPAVLSPTFVETHLSPWEVETPSSSLRSWIPPLSSLQEKLKPLLLLVLLRQEFHNWHFYNRNQGEICWEWAKEWTSYSRREGIVMKMSCFCVRNSKSASGLGFDNVWVGLSNSGKGWIV